MACRWILISDIKQKLARRPVQLCYAVNICPRQREEGGGGGETEREREKERERERERERESCREQINSLMLILALICG